LARRRRAVKGGPGPDLVASDGGVFTFGDGGFYASMGGKSLNAPMAGLAPTRRQGLLGGRGLADENCGIPI